jgi:hypothetical protein
MAEAGIPIEVIAQYLGHEDANVTRKKYARYSPTYLREAAAALEFDDLGSMNLESTTFSDEEMPEVPDLVVGGRGIEPLTPSMSRKCSSAELTARSVRESAI